MAQSSAEQDLGAEELLYVDEDLAANPPGFVVDAGGSVTKLVYRSKKDYIAGRPLEHVSRSGRGVLRLRYFDMDQVNDIVGFLEENCDVVAGPERSEEGEEWWWMTGVTAQHFKKELDSTLRIKTKLFSEMMALNNFFKNFDKMNIGCCDTEPEALSCARQTAFIFTDLFKEWRRLDSSVSDSASLPYVITTDSPSMKLLTGDLQEWKAEYLSFSGKLEYPALLVHLGSAMPLTLLRENQPMEAVDFLSGMGKMLCGLSEELTNEKNFEKFIRMAERGNLENVDLSTEDILNEEHQEEDWYKPMRKHMAAFELGKLCSHNIKGKGTYSKDDLAIGILSAMIKVISKVSFLNARLYNAKCILFSGSLPKYRVVRCHLQKNLIMESFVNNCKGGDLIKVHVLNHSGFLCALGVWMENVEKHKKGMNNDQ